MDLDAVRRERRRFARACADWTERRPHLGGALGGALGARLNEEGARHAGGGRHRRGEGGPEGLARCSRGAGREVKARRVPAHDRKIPQ